MSDERFTTETAQAAAAEDTLGDWVYRFLRSPGSDNGDLADLLEKRQCCWIGPVRIPLDQLHRLAGPPGEPVVEEVDEDYWRDDVDDLAERIDDGLEPAPVVATYKAGDGDDDEHLMLEDGNHRVEALRRSDVSEVWAVVAFDDEASRDRFIARSERS